MNKNKTTSLAIFVAVVSCGVITHANDLTWQGCGVSKTAFMEACAAEYEIQTGVRIRLIGGTTDLGIEATASGAADLGGATRHLRTFRHASEPELKLAIVAWDALAVVTHLKNPVENITRECLIQVFQQKITNWQELGGSSERILVVDRQGEWNSIRLSFRQLICHEPGCFLATALVRLQNSAQVEQLVERYPQAIAVTGISSARKRQLKVLSIDGKHPTAEAIADGAYPYYRPIYLVYRSNENPPVDQFVNWILSDQGQRVIESQGTVSNRQGSTLVRAYRHLPPSSQICNLEQLKSKSTRVFANQVPE